MMPSSEITAIARYEKMFFHKAITLYWLITLKLHILHKVYSLIFLAHYFQDIVSINLSILNHNKQR